MPTFSAAPLYPIADVRGDDAREALARAEAVLDAGAPWIQLRVKGASGARHVEIARDLVARAARRRAHVIVNDRLDVAMAADASGVHLGQTDLPLRVARQLAPALVVGLSTHDVAQAVAAEREGADYIGFGPMFETASKENALSPRRAGQLAEIRGAVSLPIIAIGGIREETATETLAQGADAVAMIGALAQAPDPGALARRLLALPRTASSQIS